MGAVEGNRARMRFFQPDPTLAPYLSAIYLNDIDIAPGARIVDMLHPEWANLRVMEGDPGAASIGPGELQPTPTCVLVGPTCYVTRFETGTMRSWEIGFLALGWTKFVGASAELYADRAAHSLGRQFRIRYGKPRLWGHHAVHQLAKAVRRQSDSHLLAEQQRRWAACGSRQHHRV